MDDERTSPSKDIRALCHYLCNMVYTGRWNKPITESEFEAYISKYNDTKKLLALRMIKEGKSTAEIERETGIKQSTIRAYKAAKIPSK